MRKQISFILILSLSGLILSACSASPAGGSGSPLVGPTWNLVELNGKEILEGTELNANFAQDGSVSGSAGCNRYNGAYSTNGQEIKMGPFATTMMACLEPLMQQETEYLTALETTKTFQIEDDRLSLIDASGSVIAGYQALSQDLAGSSWIVLSYNNGKEAVVSVIIGSEITASFDADGRLSGSAGCNRYFASYRTEADKISIESAGATEAYCDSPEGVMEQEVLYLDALMTAATYRIDGSKMEMRTAEGALVANFARAVTP